LPISVASSTPLSSRLIGKHQYITKRPDAHLNFDQRWRILVNPLKSPLRTIPRRCVGNVPQSDRERKLTGHE
jgi:hypothetical protein